MLEEYSTCSVTELRNLNELKQEILNEKNNIAEILTVGVNQIKSLNKNSKKLTVKIEKLQKWLEDLFSKRHEVNVAEEEKKSSNFKLFLKEI